jgi:hypothetical protein
MTPFTYVEASTVEQALQAFGDAEAGEAHAGAPRATHAGSRAAPTSSTS